MFGRSSIQSAQSSFVRSINVGYSNLLRSIERLASGSRINRASDGPADLVISEQLRSRIASLNQEIENTSNLINKYETASSSVSEMRRQLTELRTTALAAADGGFLNESQRAALQADADNLTASFNRNIAQGEFNSTKLFDGSEGSLADVSDLGALDLSSPAGAEDAITTIDQKIAEIDSVQIDLGSTIKHDLESRRASLEVTRQNLVASESQIRDLDYFKEYSNFIAESLRVKVGISLLSHSFLQSESVLSLFNARGR